MKKQIIVLAIASLSALAARASVVCNDNINNDPRVAAVTTVSVSEDNNQLMATIQSYGVFAHFIAAPVRFPVVATHQGPEAVEYTNTNDTFKLQVVFQPIAGKIYGTLTTKNNDGQSYSKSVICKSVEDTAAPASAAVSELSFSAPRYGCNPYLTPCPKPCDPRVQQCYRN